MHVLALVPALCLVTSLCFVAYMHLSSAGDHSPKTFSFSWGPESQNVTSEILYLNMTFEIVDEKLSIIARVNDNDFNGYGGSFGDWLCIVLDRNHNGKIDRGWEHGDDDKPYILCASNSTIEPVILIDDVNCSVPKKLPVPSPYHTCTFDPQTGYTFNVSLSLQKLALTSDVIHIIFCDSDAQILYPPAGYMHGVYVEFSFGLDELK